ncbi:Metallo-hydrolase/oxidoreductase [Mycena floridula]|nr:Metallo-hydrolase/oxidoreductase [Mycena floridula]
MPLPQRVKDQAYCRVSALEAGLIDLPLEHFIVTASPGAVSRTPSLSFLIQHSEKPQKFVFDLGIRKDIENFPPAVVKWLEEMYTVSTPQDVVESLAKGGLSPVDIDTVCLSHCHFDHVGDTRPFSSSQFVVGGESASLFQPGYPKDPKSRFAGDLLPPDRTTFLSDWQGPLGPFPRAFDFYGDGSLYIIDAPGHLPGHVNVVVRTSAEGDWLLLAGDSAHHWDLLTGASEISCDFHGCAHVDKEAAAKHIERLREFLGEAKTRLIIAHDEPWYKEYKDTKAFWPGCMDA